MNVGNSVRKSINDWELGEFESAMLHACNAVDGTARKVHPALANKARFTTLLRDNYNILGPMGLPGINLVETRFPVSVRGPTAAGGKPDLADVIYGIHRCTHGHGDELPDGFSLIGDAAGSVEGTSFLARKGAIRLSDRIIFGLLAVAVFMPANTDQHVPDGYFLSLGSEKLLINEWWGRAADFISLTACFSLPSIKMDFGDWMD